MARTGTFCSRKQRQVVPSQNYNIDYTSNKKAKDEIGPGRVSEAKEGKSETESKTQPPCPKATRSPQ
jgi:hypothetical protein